MKNRYNKSTVPNSIKRFVVLLCLISTFSPSPAQTWTPVGRVGFSAGVAAMVASDIAIDGSGTPYVVYVDSVYGGKITVMKYTGGSWAAVGTPGFSAGVATYATIAIDTGGTPYVAYVDYGSHQKATCMKYVGGSWVVVGGTSASDTLVNYTSLAIDLNGTPYVAFNDGGHFGHITVMEYSGSAWVAVGGSPGFTDSLVNSTSIAIDSAGTPYVTFVDFGDSEKAMCMKYNGSSWVNVGSADFSINEVQRPYIAINNRSIPYVIYTDNGSHLRATCMTYGSSTWATLGIAGFSDSTALFTTIAINNRGIPYAVYDDYGHSNKATCMLYNGSTWINAGNPGFSAGLAAYPSITINGNGVPYVAYTDYANGKKATVMKLSVAPITGSMVVCAGDTVVLSDTTSGGAWSSGNTSVATVGSTGVVTGVAGGAVAISYTASGISSVFQVTVSPAGAGVIFGADTVCAGDTITLTDAVTGGAWSSTNTAVAAVTGPTLVRGIAAGRDTIRYIIANSCVTDTATFPLYVRPASLCPTGVVTLSNTAVSALTVTPNPGNGTFMVNLSAAYNENVPVIVTNMAGQKVGTYGISANKETPIQLNVPPGIYFMSAFTKDKRMVVKVVVE